jgi:hypothetical protein
VTLTFMCFFLFSFSGSTGTRSCGFCSNCLQFAVFSLSFTRSGFVRDSEGKLAHITNNSSYSDLINDFNRSPEKSFPHWPQPLPSSLVK